MLKKEEINNFNIIMELITIDPNFENISDIIFLLDRHDQFRENNDPELKYAVFTIVSEILNKKIAKPIYGYSPIAPLPNPLPIDTEETIKYLDRYWGDDSNKLLDIGRSYLLFFAKDGSSIGHNYSNTL